MMNLQMLGPLKKYVANALEQVRNWGSILENRAYYHIVGRMIHVLSIEETIDEIINNRKSISRFGDGEFALIYGESIGFQKNNRDLQKRLKDVLLSNEDNVLICVSDFFTNKKMNMRTDYNKKWWVKYFRANAKKWLVLLSCRKTYGNLSISRFYIPFKDKKKSKYHSDLLKHIWMDKDIIIVEGDKTRMGVGNDLFITSKSIKRIIAPAKNAFLSYNMILDECKKYTTNNLFLIALGPTATVLAYDLAKAGYHAIDIGHIDLEYEWMKMGVQRQVALPNRYVNEAANGDKVASIDNPQYLSEIVARIGVE